MVSVMLTENLSSLLASIFAIIASSPITLHPQPMRRTASHITNYPSLIILNYVLNLPRTYPNLSLTLSLLIHHS
jgi:hypothetical protein